MRLHACRVAAEGIHPRHTERELLHQPRLDGIDGVAGKTRGEIAMTGIDPWVEAGIPPAVILRAMTTNATRLLGVDAVRGTLKPGMFADLIATPDNPLSNIQTLKRVTFVMKNGRVVKNQK